MLRGQFLPGSYTGRTPTYQGGYQGESGSAPQATLAVALTDNGPVMTQAALSLVATPTVSVNTATTVVMTITLDASLTYASASGSGWTCGAVGQVVTCTRASLSAGAGPAVTIGVTTGNATVTAASSVSLAASNGTTANGSDSASVLLVSKDATSGKRWPASATEWTNVMSIAGLATGNPSALWLMQDASGNPADSIGAFTLTASGSTLAYQQAVAGWTRTAITTTDGGTALLQTIDPGLPSIDATSCLVLAYVNLPASFGASERSLITLGLTYGLEIACDSDPNSNPAQVALAQSGAVSQAATTATTGVHPIIVQMNVTGSVPYVVTDADATTHALAGGQTGKGIRFGGNNIQTWNSAATGYLCGAMFAAGAAELTKAQMKTLLTTLGWSVAWS